MLEKDFMSLLERVYDGIVSAGNKLGRAVSRQALYLFYIVKEGDLSSSERAMCVAALAYIAVPGDLIPRKVFRVLGITDDALALAYLVKKLKGKLTPDIKMKVERLLDDWFGYAITRV